MSKGEFTREQLEFLELFKIAAKYDCVYLLDYHCFNLFEHDQTSILTDAERSMLAAHAQRDIFAEALQQGFEPDQVIVGGISEQKHLC
ncbi:MAG: hypothetical protein ABJL55_12240 [Roseibium sp.]